MVKVLDHGYVKLIPKGCCGSDEIIIESARMSTDGAFRGWGPLVCPECSKLDTPEAKWTYSGCKKCKGSGTVEGDEKLLARLWRDKHTSPFEMAYLTVEIQAPLFVARELVRHRTFSWNELSGRYAELPNLFYLPSIERLERGGQSKSNKQGSGELLKCPNILRAEIESAQNMAYGSYESLLKKGLSRELARVVLPVSIYTRWRWSGNLRNWLQMLSLRLPEDVQEETRLYGREVAAMVGKAFPRTFKLFKEGLPEGTIPVAPQGETENPPLEGSREG